MRFGSAVFAMVPKVLLKRFKPKKLKEGAGFIVRRPVGGGQISDKESDPFLLLDELGPVTYKKGEFQVRRGTRTAGSTPWRTSKRARASTATAWAITGY